MPAAVAADHHDLDGLHPGRAAALERPRRRRRDAESRWGWRFSRGMLGVTIFGVLVTPVFFYLIDTVSESSLFGSTAGAADRPRDPGNRDALVPLAALALAIAGPNQQRPLPVG